jgi:hypothetical protein
MGLSGLHRPMRLALLRILAQQRALYDQPRDMARFRSYLAQMTGGTDDIALPIVGMNPMGKDKAKAAYDALLAIGAEDAAEAALKGAERRLAEVPGELKVALVVQDDLEGAWSQPAFVQAQAWQSNAMAKRGFAAAHFLTSQAPFTATQVQQEVLAEVFRIAWMVARGRAPATLAEVVEQQGHALAFAGAPPWLPEAQVAAARERLAPHLQAKADWPECMAAMFGDHGAAAMGHAPLGLPERAGFAVGLADALRAGRPPEAVLTP